MVVGIAGEAQERELWEVRLVGFEKNCVGGGLLTEEYFNMAQR